MTNNSGFGKVQATKKATKSAAKRNQAGKQYDKMKADGVPEFNIYIRVQGKKNWYPAGSLAVNRTSQINQAIFQEEDNLRQGAVRLYPVLKKNQTQLEYGYKLKGAEFADDLIQVAVPPAPGVANFFQTAIAKVQNTFSGLFKKK